MVHADSGTSASGVVVMQDQAGSDWYLWMNSTGELRRDSSDPGASATGGYGVGAKLTHYAKTANYTVLASESNAVFTNAGATGSVNFTLPSAAVGLRYLFYVAAAQSLQIAAAGTEEIVREGISDNAWYSSTEFEFFSIVCVKSGTWLVDRYFGFTH